MSKILFQFCCKFASHCYYVPCVFLCGKRKTVLEKTPQGHSSKNSIGDLSLGTLITTLEKTSRRVSPEELAWRSLSSRTLFGNNIGWNFQKVLFEESSWRYLIEQDSPQLLPGGAAPLRKAKKTKRKKKVLGRTVQPPKEKRRRRRRR